MIIRDGYTYESTRPDRPAFFATNLYGELHFGSDGGTLVLARFQEKVFVITCRHVISAGNPLDLAVHFDLSSEISYKPNLAFNVPRDVNGRERDDILICTWRDDFRRHFEIENLVDLDDFVEAEEGDALSVAGFLKDRSHFDFPRGKAFAFETATIDRGRTTLDPDLRTSAITLEDAEKERATGLSGGLVFNISKKSPAGIIVRANDLHGDFVLHYVSFDSIFPMLSVIIESGELNSWVYASSFDFNLHFPRRQELRRSACGDIGLS